MAYSDEMDLRGAVPDLRIAARADALRVRVEIVHDIEAVADDWRELAAFGVQSPGLDLDFVRLWIAALAIPPEDQFFLRVHHEGRVLMLLPLRRRRMGAFRVLGWFAGSQVGARAPLADLDRLAAMTPGERAALWDTVRRSVRGADVICLRDVPTSLHGEGDLFAEMGHSLEVDCVHRAEFSSWEAADATQRNKSRRKHDRQQGDRLAALGQVDFEEVRPGPDAEAALAIMFAQRAARFRAQGIANPFADPRVRRFYDWSVGTASPLDVRLHVLRLNGAVVAVRYNVVVDGRYYCLISSMSEDCAIQAGSPGKQCLLRVMQTIFDAGASAFDMGVGATDEKRHWCNVSLPVRRHYLPLTPLGHAGAFVHRFWQQARMRIKANKVLVTRCREAIRTLGRLRSA